MNAIKRLFRYLKALLNGTLDKLEDPEIIINEAVREMKENQIKNRELAVQAITQKNNLQAEVDKEERMTAELERKATIALHSGNRELAKQFLREKAMHDQTLQSMRTNLASATEASEKVKLAIRQEEDRIRMRTAEALAMKANMKQAQIQIQINKALDGLQFSEPEQQWTHVQERIQSMQSEAQARSEVAGTSIDARLREVEVSQADVEADRMVSELEQKLSLGTSPANNYSTATSTVQQVQTVGGAGNNGGAQESEIDRQLRELEQKLGGQK
jgi:phage shock protein A